MSASCLFSVLFSKMASGEPAQALLVNHKAQAGFLGLGLRIRDLGFLGLGSGVQGLRV